MNAKFPFFIVITIGIWSGFAQAASLAEFLPRKNYGAKLEPVDRIIHMAGQSEENAYANYVQTMGRSRMPQYFMAYTRANRTVEDQTARMENFGRILERYTPDVGLQLGFAMMQNGVSHAQEIIDGQHDASITACAEVLAAMKRPVFLRIGYEANGFWNGYSPATYNPAFRRIAGIFREKAPEIAIVWCIHPIDSLARMLQFHPGDDFIDWWSIDLFEIKFLNSNNTTAFLREADLRGKPVLIGETTPREVGVHDPDAWTKWYQVYFNIIRTNPGIKGFSYINRQWENFSSYAGWKDSRLEANESVAAKYREEMDHPLYLHSSTEAEHRPVLLNPVRDASVWADGGAGKEEIVSISGSASGTRKWVAVSFSTEGLHAGSEADLWMLSDSTISSRSNIPVYAADTEDWSEDSVATGARPQPMGTTLGTLESGSLNNQRWASLNVTSILQAALLAGKETVTVILAPDDTISGAVRLFTREGIAATRPSLREGVQLLVKTPLAPAGTFENYEGWLIRNWATAPAFRSPQTILHPAGAANIWKYVTGRNAWGTFHPRLHFESTATPILLILPVSAWVHTDASLRLESSETLSAWETYGDWNAGDRLDSDDEGLLRVIPLSHQESSNFYRLKIVTELTQ